MIVQWKTDNEGRWTAQWCGRLLTLTAAAPSMWTLCVTAIDGVLEAAGREWPAGVTVRAAWSTADAGKAAVEKVLERIIAVRLHTTAAMWPVNTDRCGGAYTVAGRSTVSTVNIGFRERPIPYRERRRAGPFSADDKVSCLAEGTRRGLNLEGAHA